MAFSHRTVLVTGCSSGIGRASALLLAEKGFRVFAGVRCQKQASELSEAGSDLLEPLLLDVTSAADIERVERTVSSACPHGLHGLVNNAGVGLPAAVELTEPDELRKLFEVNTVAPLRMIQTFLPLLRIARGRVINMSSMNGTVALPMVGAYSASKFALEALSDTLRVELRPWRIDVSLIRPGQVKTEIFTKAQEELQKRICKISPELKDGYGKLYDQAYKFSQRGERSPTSPEQVARVVLRALKARRPRTHYHVGLDSHGLNSAKKFVPQRLLDRLYARAMGVLKPLD